MHSLTRYHRIHKPELYAERDAQFRQLAERQQAILDESQQIFARYKGVRQAVIVQLCFVLRWAVMELERVSGARTGIQEPVE